MPHSSTGNSIGNRIGAEGSRTLGSRQAGGCQVLESDFLSSPDLPAPSKLIPRSRRGLDIAVRTESANSQALKVEIWDRLPSNRMNRATGPTVGHVFGLRQSATISRVSVLRTFSCGRGHNPSSSRMLSQSLSWVSTILPISANEHSPPERRIEGRPRRLSFVASGCQGRSRGSSIPFAL